MLLYFPIVTFCLLICTIVQLVYWLGLFRRLINHKEQNHVGDVFTPVSVVICARNEEKNLTAYLPKVLSQDYPVFEVIVVDDCSTDGTQSVLKELSKQYPQLTVITLNTKITPGKKGALAMGISQAKYDWLLLTDADCEPRSKYWIANMIAPTKETAIKIVLGLSPYRVRSGLLNAFIQYETFLTAVQYLSYALAGIPYMGVGRNLLYHRSIFEEAGGFKWHEHITSGDDDLLMSRVAMSHNTAICVSYDAQTVSSPPNKYGIYYKQKRRHLSTGVYYKKNIKFLLSVFTLSHCFTYICLFISIIFKISTMFVLCLYVTRIIVVFPIAYMINKSWHTHIQLVWLILLDLLLPMYILFMSHALILNSHRWK